jgi:hypothetical protein
MLRLDKESVYEINLILKEALVFFLYAYTIPLLSLISYTHTQTHTQTYSEVC